MAGTQIGRWIKFTLVTPIAVILHGAIFQPVVAQQNQAETDNQACQITRYRPEISGPDNEWLRIERCGGTVRVIHTRRGTENRGVLGVVNIVTDLTGPRAGFTRWYDNPTTRVTFQPDGCTETSESADFSSCVITGTEELLLPANVDIHDGQFMIEYTDGELVRSIAFRLPVEEN